MEYEYVLFDLEKKLKRRQLGLRGLYNLAAASEFGENLNWHQSRPKSLKYALFTHSIKKIVPYIQYTHHMFKNDDFTYRNMWGSLNNSGECHINYLCTYDLYSPVHNVLDTCISITWGSGRGLGALEFSSFLGPKKHITYRNMWGSLNKSGESHINILCTIWFIQPRA